MSPADVVTLFRPVGPKELELIRASGYRAFPPRLPEQPIFYPVLTRECAVKIARDWNVRAGSARFPRAIEGAEYRRSAVSGILDSGRKPRGVQREYVGLIEVIEAFR